MNVRHLRLGALSECCRVLGYVVTGLFSLLVQAETAGSSLIVFTTCDMPDRGRRLVTARTSWIRSTAPRPSQSLADVYDVVSSALPNYDS